MKVNMKNPFFVIIVLIIVIIILTLFCSVGMKTHVGDLKGSFDIDAYDNYENFINKQYTFKYNSSTFKTDKDILIYKFIKSFKDNTDIKTVNSLWIHDSSSNGYLNIFGENKKISEYLSKILNETTFLIEKYQGFPNSYIITASIVKK